MAPPQANSTATDGNSQPKIGKQDPSSTSNQDLGQGFNKSHSSIYAMGQSNPDIDQDLDWMYLQDLACLS